MAKSNGSMRAKASDLSLPQTVLKTCSFTSQPCKAMGSKHSVKDKMFLLGFRMDRRAQVLPMSLQSDMEGKWISKGQDGMGAPKTNSARGNLLAERAGLILYCR